jgi:CMP-N-acetylneuraminic acid synthetase
MYKGRKIIAIIPARGGSKRLPRKNVLPLAGKPLIGWAIEAASESGVFTEIMVNTDDAEIADISKKYTVTVPFMRSSELGSDTASTLDVIIDTLKKYRELGKEFDIVVLLQPTSPLRTGADIRRAVDMFIDKNANSVLSVCEVDHPVQWAGTLDESCTMDTFIKPEFKGKRSQELPTHYRLNGAVYVWNSTMLVEFAESIIAPSFACIMPRDRSIDIDEKIDFAIAEALIKNV